MAKKFEAGDRIVFHNSRANREGADILDLTLGKIYTVYSPDDDPYVLDDVNERNYACGELGSAKWTKIVD